MIRVGFTIVDGKTNWMGGINYLNNLLYAISMLEKKQIEPVLFVGNKTDEKLAKQFEGLAEIQRDSLFDRGSVKWFIYTFMRDLFKRNFLINKIIKHNKIDVFSHSYIYGPDLACPTINWIPDFQHVRLPHLYSKLHLGVRDFRLRSLAKYSDSVFLSSYDALDDFSRFTPQFASKARVVHFVSQVSSFENKDVAYLEEKYGFRGKYYFLPNQFWTHKNHKTAFEAIKAAKKEVPDIRLICTGLLSDGRNANHIKKLEQFVENNELNENILLLGLIPFSDVLIFMMHSLAIVNPSHFEGWSSTVEEAKSMKKNLILSRIPVHQEQVTRGGSFFDPDSSEELANILVDKWNKTAIIRDLSHDYSNDLRINTIEFGTAFQNVVMDVVGAK